MMTAEIELHVLPPKSYIYDRVTLRRAGSRSLPFVGRRDLHTLAIFGNGAPGHRYALLRQNFRELAVAPRIFRILLRNQFFDLGAYGGGRHFRAVGRLDMAGKEVPELEHAARRVHVFGGGHP